MALYSLGLDSSTQSLTAIVIDIEDGRIVYERSLDYVVDDRLYGFGIDHREYIAPPREPGEADQPPMMFPASLDAMFADMRSDEFPIHEIVAVNVSGQQHGHVYLGETAAGRIAALQAIESADEGSLQVLLAGIFSYGTAPIWRTSNTGVQADAIRDAVGGSEQMIRLSGSDSPLRFTGAVVRRVGTQFPDAYRKTARIQLISSFLPAVLCGNVDVPMDHGNGCGTSLMDYAARAWSRNLLDAVADGLPGGSAGLAKKLPGLSAPDTVVGTMAGYFTKKYGFSPECVVAAGSGDNPQTKVLVRGDLLSLGTSFVNMVSTEGDAVDLEGYANAMYDGVGRPFMFGCRTNGAMTWDRVRALHGLGKEEYDPADQALATTVPGSTLCFWQPDGESFPPSPSFHFTRVGYAAMDLGRDYGGIIDSSLAAVYLFSKGFAPESTEPIYVTGGATSSREILRRVAAIWKRGVIPIGKVGAGLGAAVAGAGAYMRSEEREFDIESLSSQVLPRGETVEPDEEDIERYHGPGGYLLGFAEEYRKLIS
jgi:xylulokinase